MQWMATSHMPTSGFIEQGRELPFHLPRKEHGSNLSESVPAIPEFGW